MGFLSDLLGKSAEKASQRAAAIEQEKQDRAQRGRLAAGEEFSGTLGTISQLFEQVPEGRGDEAFEAIANLLGLRGTQGRDAAIEQFRATPGFEFAQEQGQQAVQRALEAGGIGAGGRAIKESQRFSQGLADQNVQQFISNLFGLGQTESAAESQRVANQANTLTRGAEGLLGAKSSAFADRFRAASPTAQGVVSGANARAAGAQNLLNAGLTLAGTFAPTGGLNLFGRPGGSSSR